MEALILCAVVGLPIAAIAIAAYFGNRRANAQFEATQRAIESSSTSADVAGPIPLDRPKRMPGWSDAAIPTPRPTSIPGTLADGLRGDPVPPYHTRPATNADTSEAPPAA